MDIVALMISFAHGNLKGHRGNLGETNFFAFRVVGPCLHFKLIDVERLLN